MTKASDIQARGYILAMTFKFLRETAGERKTEEILASVSPALREVVPAIQPAAFYPLSMFAELNRTLVTHLAGNDEEKAEKVLIECGRYIGKEASNTFLKLLMRMLTPKLIMKKIPDFWKRDVTGGRVEVHARENGLQCFMYDLEGYDHCCPLSAGWQQYNLEVMGKSLESTTVLKWSLAAPSQDGTSFEITWKP